MKLLIDMNLSPLWVEYLNRSGFESIHWSQVGLPAALDTEIMEHASTRSLVIFTHDLDFGTLLAHRNSSRPSVVQVRCQDILPADIGDLVIRALKASQAHLDQGALVTVDPNRARIRLLPLEPRST